MKKIFVLGFVISFLSLFLGNGICAQSLPGRVEGKVVSSDDEIALPETSIAILQLPDSVVTDVVMTDMEGKFSINLRNINCILLATKYGYESKYLNPNLPIIDIVLTPSSQELEEVTIRATKTNMKAKPGMFVFEPGNLCLYVNSASKVLDYVPLLGREGKDNLTIFSKSGYATIFINGKKQLMDNQVLLDRLKALPADKIKKIELIMNPGAEYDEDVLSGGIVNIVLEDDMLGWNANTSVSATYGNKIFSSLYPGLTWYFQNHGFLLSASLSYAYDRTKDRISEIYIDDNIRLQRNINSKRRGDSNSLNGRITGEYSWGRSSIGLTAGLYSSKSFESFSYEMTESKEENSLYGENSNSYSNSPWSKLLMAGIRYIYKFDDQGMSELTVTGIYNQDFPNHNNYFLNVEASDIKLQRSVCEINQSYVYKNQSEALSISFNKRFGDGSMLNISGIASNGRTNQDYTDTSSGYIYQNDLFGEMLSASYMRQWNEIFSSRVGIRQEYFKRGISLKNTGEKYDDDFLLFLPNISLTFLFGGGRNSMNVDWYAQTNHPVSSQLNPYRRWISSTEYSEGNPHIPITMNHNVSLQYGLLGQYFLSVRYFTGKSSNENYIFIDDDGNAGSTYLLNKISHNLNLDLSFNKNLFDYRWRIGASASMLWRNSKARVGDEKRYNHSLNFYASLNTSVVISWKYDLRVSASYMFSGEDREMMQKVSANQSLNFGIEKGLWKNADIEASINVPLSKTYTTLISEGVTKEIRSMYSDDLSARVTFNWYFGKLSIERVRNISL